MKDFTDRQILQFCLNKDPKGWESFLSRFSNLIWWAIKYKLTICDYRYTKEDLEDIFQEVLSCLWERKKLEKIRHTDRISSWLVIVSSNITVDYLRNKRHEPQQTQYLYQNPINSNAEDPSAEDIISSQDTRNMLYTNELNRILEETISSLSLKEKDILILNFLYEKKHREIAQILKLSQNTVSTTIARAKEKLKQRLIDKGIQNV